MSNKVQSLDLDNPNHPNQQLDGPVECLGKTFENDQARREYYLTILAEKLKDPEFRKIEGFPIGEDEDILNLSDPPYYTACPNPFLKEHIEWWNSNFRISEKNITQASPYIKDVEATMRDPVLNLHSYHTKVPPAALASLVLHYTQPGDIILDAYAGSGMTALGVDLCTIAPPTQLDESIRAKYGPRSCILADLSALASHIEGAHVRALPADFESVASSIIECAEHENEWLYEVEEETGKYKLRFSVWSEFYSCENCSAEIEAWSSQVDFENISIKKFIFCQSCNTELKIEKLKRVITTEYDPVLGELKNSTKKRMRWIVLNTPAGRFERESNSADMRSTERAVSLLKHLNVPIQKIPYMHMSHERNDLPSLGYDYVHSFFTQRTLFAVSDLFSRIHASNISPTNKRWMIYLITSVLDTHLVVRNRYLIDKHHASGTTCGPLSGTLYVPTLQCEVNVYEAIKKKLKKIAIASNSLQIERGIVSNQAAQSLDLPENSIDYIFIDPPFGANINYSDLNFISESWLKVKTSRQPEAVIDSAQGKDLNEYGELMTLGLLKCFNALKSGGWITLLFHNSKNSVWNSIQDALLSVGFIVADVRVLDKGGTTIFQDSQAAAVKKDLLISAYKPVEKLAEMIYEKSLFPTYVWDFVASHLNKLAVYIPGDNELVPVRERERHLLFDRMVAFFVIKGFPVPISASEFYIGLEERYPKRNNMYFLAEQVAEFDRKVLSVGKVKQLSIFIDDEASAIEWLRQLLKDKSYTFQEIHPKFINELSSWKKSEITLELSKILEQNFLFFDGKGQTPSQIHSYLSTSFKEYRNLAKDDPQLLKKAKGRWFIPDPNDEVQLQALRDKDLLKQFEEYKNFSGKKLKLVRLEAVRAGFKHAWQNHDYATIVQVAEKFPEYLIQEDPKLMMWHTNAQTRYSDSNLF